jgi:hypothetical protein
MYLAPLNYDRYFKKVFSDIEISKRFLEDFFEIEIEEIELMQTSHKITDDATAVEFDFRCKIAGSFVIIDMQQWFKTDVVKRFYMYHCMNTALQLEKIPDKSVGISPEKKSSTKDYNRIIPVITLIWMVDDSLGFTDDYVAYTMAPETVIEFINNKQIWCSEPAIEALRKEHKKCLDQLSNKTKNLDFMQSNRLIYAFQKNIAKNHIFSKYQAWFELAEKTLDKLNRKDWFQPYLKDDIFAEIVKRLSTEAAKSEEVRYIEDYDKFREEVKRYEESIYVNAKEEGREEERQIQKQKQRQEKLEIALKLKKAGLVIQTIADSTGLSIYEIEKL